MRPSTSSGGATKAGCGSSTPVRFPLTASSPFPKRPKAMGFFTGLVTLPLAPIRGTAWLAQQLAEEAERQLHDESRLRRELMQLELEHDDGVIDDQRYAEQLDVLVEAISQARAYAAANRGSPEDPYGS